jgi:hypothetical protein
MLVTTPEKTPPDWSTVDLDSVDWGQVDWLQASTIMTEIRTVRIFVTPKLAKHWLTKNLRNRSMVPAIVSRYARMMSEGLWTETSDAVGFYASDGAVQNGQKRLAAVGESGCGQTFDVKFGMPEESMKGQDQGQKRSARDQFELALGDRRAAAYVGAHKMLLTIRWTWRGRMSGFNDYRHGPDTTDMLNLAEEEFLDAAFEVGKRAQKSEARIHASIAAALYYEMAAMYGDDVPTQFFERVANGEHLDRTQPEYMLRRWLINNKKGLARAPTQQVVGMILKAFNMRVLGERLEALSYSPNKETLPKLGQGLNRITAARREQKRRAASS